MVLAGQMFPPLFSLKITFSLNLHSLSDCTKTTISQWNQIISEVIFQFYYVVACVTYCVLDLVIDPHDFHYPQTRSPRHSRDTNISDINYTILQKRGMYR